MCRLNLRFHRIPVIMFLISLTLILSGQEEAATMADGFREPPESALPRTWWHWTNSNITKEGITKYLEWMKRVGIGGMHLADVAAGQGQTVENKILFRSPEWFDAVRHTASEAERLGLEMTIFSSAGWSLTGGPWVKPEQAMKKLVWSEINLSGPLSYTGKLPDPPSFEGQIRNLSNSPKPAPVYYKDFVVLAFPTPPEETEAAPKAPAATTGSGDIDPSASHVYGKKLVAAEAYTGGGYESPNTLKKIGDYWFAQGINRFVFHTSAHQPLDAKINWIHRSSMDADFYFIVNSSDKNTGIFHARRRPRINAGGLSDIYKVHEEAFLRRVKYG